MDKQILLDIVSSQSNTDNIFLSSSEFSSQQLKKQSMFEILPVDDDKV